MIWTRNASYNHREYIRSVDNRGMEYVYIAYCSFPVIVFFKSSDLSVIPFIFNGIGNHGR